MSAPDTTTCDHTWRLMEQGYVRTWSIEMRQESHTIVASYCGSEDFSEEGDGKLWLQCSTCVTIQPVPSGWDVDFD